MLVAVKSSRPTLQDTGGTETTQVNNHTKHKPTALFVAIDENNQIALLQREDKSLRLPSFCIPKSSPGKQFLKAKAFKKLGLRLEDIQLISVRDRKRFRTVQSLYVAKLKATHKDSDIVRVSPKELRSHENIPKEVCDTIINILDQLDFVQNNNVVQLQFG